MNRARPLATLALASWAIGCEAFLPNGGPGELPDVLAFVVENADDFAQDSDGPLADVPPGTMLDDLVGLDGCWGAYGVFESTSGTPLLADFEVYRFDIEAGQMTWGVFQRDVFGLLSVVSVFSGTFSTEGGNQVRFDVTESMATDPQTGRIESLPPASAPERFNLAVTVSADSMKISPQEYASQPPDQRDELVFARFECPR